MNKKIKKLALTMATVMSFSTVSALGACTPTKTPDTEDHLEIFLYKAGYGYEWLEEMIDAFQAKNPNITVSYDGDTLMAYETTIASDKNTIDLFIEGGDVSNLVRKGGEVLKGYDCVVEPLDDLFASDLGNGQTFEDKMMDYHLPAKINGHYYQVPWTTGNNGIIYNKTKFDELGVSVPRTTNEMLTLCDTLVGEGETPFVFSAATGYWMSLLNIWYYQYEGTQGVSNFYNGITEDNKLSRDIFLQQGRLEALETLESLIGRDKGYTHTSVNSLNFTQAQAQLILGNGLMQANGEWFESEMKSVQEEDTNDFEFRMMRTPIISSIIDKLSTVNDEATLLRVIDYIDGKEVDVTGISTADIERVREARFYGVKNGRNNMFIPVYSKAKTLAKEFIKFMASDEAYKIYVKHSEGNQLPFEYDLENDAELWNGLSNFQKENYKFKQQMITMDRVANTSLATAGLMFFTKENIEIYFTAVKDYDRKTALQIYNEDYDYWTVAKFENVLKIAGII